MIAGLLVPSILVAAAAAAVAFWLGWGVWASTLIYTLGGSLTLLLLAARVARFVASDGREDREAG